MPRALLPDRSLFSITGDDAVPFLQGLITNDATLLEKNTPIYAALLTPQGKFLHDFFLIPTEGRILLDVNASRAEDLIKRLNIYKLRSKITITPLPDKQVFAGWDEAAPEGITIQDPRLAALGYRSYGAYSADAPHNGYEAHRISLVIPDGAKDMQVEKSLLLEFHFESLHGVSFSKGCYVGQEVTARSKFRGQVRRQLYQVSAPTALPARATPILGNDAVIGELLSIHGAQGLALIKSDELEKANGVVTAEGVALSCNLPGWVTVEGD